LLINVQKWIQSTMCFLYRSSAICRDCLLGTQKSGMGRPNLHGHWRVNLLALPYNWHCQNVELVWLNEHATVYEIGSCCTEKLCVPPLAAKADCQILPGLVSSDWDRSRKRRTMKQVLMYSRLIIHSKICKIVRST